MEDNSKETESTDAVSTLIPNAFEVSCLIFMAYYSVHQLCFDILIIGLFSILQFRCLIRSRIMERKILKIFIWEIDNKLKYALQLWESMFTCIR